MPTVTVVPADNLVIVDGEALGFPFEAPSNLHAVFPAVSRIVWTGTNPI